MEVHEQESNAAFCSTPGERWLAVGLFVFIIIYAVWPMAKGIWPMAKAALGV